MTLLLSRFSEEQALRDLSSQWEPRLRAKWLSTVRQWSQSGEMEALFADVRAGVSNLQLIKRVESLQLPASELSTLLAEIQALAGRAAAKVYGLNFLQNVTRFMIDHSTERMVDISNNARAAIRQTLVSADRQGLSLEETTTELRDSIPLDQRGKVALDNYKNALKKNPGMARGIQKQRVAEYKNRLVSHRADTIARTETLNALNMGKRNTFIAAYQTGLLDATDQLEWITAGDEFVCPVCGPLNGKKATLGGTFASINGPIYSPPLHPNCRCTTGLARK